jgi:hypothetical protein
MDNKQTLKILVVCLNDHTIQCIGQRRKFANMNCDFCDALLKTTKVGNLQDQSYEGNDVQSVSKVPKMELGSRAWLEVQ